MKTRQNHERLAPALCKWCVLYLLSCQLAAAYPAAEPCQQLHVGRVATHVNEIPKTIVKQLELFGAVRNVSWVIPLVEPKQNVSRDELWSQVLETLGQKYGKHGKVCIGRHASTSGEKDHPTASNADLLVVYISDEEDSKKPLSSSHKDISKGSQPRPLILLMPTISQRDSLSLLVSCDWEREMCLDISFNGLTSTGNRLQRRNAIAGHMTSDVSHDTGNVVMTRSIIVSVLVAVVGLLLLVSVVAMCGGSDTYNTVKGVPYKQDETVSVTPSEPSPSINAQVEVVEKQNGDMVENQTSPAEDVRLTSPSRSSDSRSSITLPLNVTSPLSIGDERKERARTLSARSFDPLPALPNLDSVEDESDDMKTKHIINDKAEPEYSYARVPGRMEQEMSEAESSDEEIVDSPEPEKSLAPGLPPCLPPYGKVTRNPNSDTVISADEYAEVSGDIFIVPNPVRERDRSATAPVEPSELDVFRNVRAFTESATHLPLPAIPRGPRPPIVEDSEMYDSIPEGLEGKKAKPSNIRLTECLYESVDEMSKEPEDMYESVPEKLTMLESPTLSPLSSVPTPSSEGFPATPCESPLPPSGDKNVGANSKSNKTHGKNKKVEKKTLEPTLSSSEQGEKKRSFSMFRKKTGTTSTGLAKPKKKSEKDQQPHKSHHHDPLPDIPLLSSPSPVVSPLRPPSVPSPALPNASYNEDEDLYDEPELPPTNQHHTADSNLVEKMTTEDARYRAKSLPVFMRNEGASVFKFRQDIPLPDVPEDSGSGQGMVTVAHTRVFEDDTEGLQPYDLVVIRTPPPADKEEDHNYDTVKLDEILDPSSEVRRDANDDDSSPEDERADEKRGESHIQSPNELKFPTVLEYAELTSPERDSTNTLAPEHDDVGYAVVPEMVKMRKRALSASQVKQHKTSNQQDASTTDSDASNSTSREMSPRRITSPSKDLGEQYAVVDMAAKRKKRTNTHETMSPTENNSSRTSPIPPPLPPIGDLGDLSEFVQPPLPQRLENVDRLVVKTERDSGYSRVLKVSSAGGSSDPPYAKVKSKNEHPYAELNIGGVGPPEVGVIGPVHNEMSSGYDTVGDLDAIGAKETAPIVPVDDQHMYDTLTVVPKAEAVKEATNVYHTLEVVQNETENDVDGDEEPYEEIDEEVRLNLQKRYQL